MHGHSAMPPKRHSPRPAPSPQEAEARRREAQAEAEAERARRREAQQVREQERQAEAARVQEEARRRYKEQAADQKRRGEEEERAKQEAERKLHEVDQYHYPQTLFSEKERALAAHARQRLRMVADHDEWFVTQKSKWAAEKLQADVHHRLQHHTDPPPAGHDELIPTVMGRVVSSGVAEGTDFDIDPPPGLAVASSARVQAGGQGNWRLRRPNDGVRREEAPGASKRIFD